MDEQPTQPQQPQEPQSPVQPYGNLPPTPPQGGPYSSVDSGGIQVNIGGNYPSSFNPSYAPAYGVPVYGKKMGRAVSAIILVVFGLVFAGAGFLVSKQAQIPADYAQTTGRVTQELPVTGTVTRNGYTQSVIRYSPVIQFMVSGQTYSFTGSTTGNAPNYSIGQTVQVAYSPTNPGTNPKNASDKSSKILAPIFIAVGGLLFLAGIVIFFIRPKTQH